MRKTKIVCTIGPATQNEETIKRLMLAGMNVARVNFSHGSYEYHKVTVDMVKKVREELDLPIPLLLDTKGPEVRIGKFETGKINVVQGQEFIITTRDILGNSGEVSISYKGLINDVQVGTKILISDGLIELEVKQITDVDIICTVLNSGALSDNKSCNVPSIHLNLPAITEKDINDIKFGIENGFDIVAASFIRRAEDVLDIRKVLNNNGGSDIIIISKIENSKGIENIDEIIKVSDGIMVARGDLGVEIPIEDVPIVQKMLIQKCIKAGKPVITATQMLESMIQNPRPTRAEASDITNAIYDGTSAIMLSGETAAGKYPVESVETMGKIAERAELSIDYKERFQSKLDDPNASFSTAISHAACTTAHNLHADAIIVPTSSGGTAKRVIKFKPACKIIATTLKERVRRQLNLSWGVIPLLSSHKETDDDIFQNAMDLSIQSGNITVGDLIVVVTGTPVGISKTTNTLKIHLVGDILVQGNLVVGSTDNVTGILCVAKDTDFALKNFSHGHILVVPKMCEKLVPLIKDCSALIIEENDIEIQNIVESLSLNIPVIVGVDGATDKLINKAIVTVDHEKGMVYCATRNRCSI